MLATEITDVDFGTYNLPGSQLDDAVLIIPEQNNRSIGNTLVLSDRGNKTKTIFTLFNERFLSVKRESKRDSGAESIIDLAYLDEKANESVHYPIGMYLVACLSIVCCAVSYWLISMPFLVSATAFAVAVVFMVFAIESMKSTVTFNTMISAIPVLEFSIDNSIRRDAENFVEDIKKGIICAKQSLPAGKQLTPVLVAEMRRLSETGLISMEQYEVVKAEIFSGTKLA